jgi:transcriptional regulator with XRE-family HTH domain
MTKTDMHAHFIARLRAARMAVGLSQTALGMRMGLTKDIASTRINRYETGVSEPDLRTAERMARELGVSLSWLVCTDPKMADMIDGFAKLDAAGQDALLDTLQRALRKLTEAPAKAARTEEARQKRPTQKTLGKKSAIKKTGAKKPAGDKAAVKKAGGKAAPTKKAPVGARVRKVRQQVDG